MNFRSQLGFILVLVFLLSCEQKGNSDKKIKVSCASSLLPILNHFKTSWEKDHSEKIIINAASSGTLARQIENGAQADLFLSANREWTKYLTQSMNLDYQEITIASNRLAVVAPLDSKKDSTSFYSFANSISTNEGKIAIGNPGHVPLGKYTQQALENNNLYKVLIPDILHTKDARSALRLVELGEVEWGVVYLSDGITSEKVKIVALVPAEDHENIIYQAIIISDQKGSSKKFIDFIISRENHEIWKSNGFIP